ncbi:hypothetical protein KJ765_04055 [Candidatus Micrarchaeota archaeon]|nr:hypothetical protein [Candidatus Micrarchaeota archaeon]
MRPAVSKVFTFVISLFLVLQMNAPFVYAESLSFASPTPTTPPTTAPIVTTIPRSYSCNLKQMDVNEYNRFLDLLKDFQTQEISSVPEEKLREYNPANKTQTDQVLNINVNVAQQAIYPIKTITDALGYSDEDREKLAKEFNVDPEYGVLTFEQMRAIASQDPARADTIGQILSGVSGISGKPKVDSQPYEQFKVLLPSGEEVPLFEIMNLVPQNKDNNCLLDRTHIQGKTTFMALLDKDLFVGFDQSPTAMKSNQHLTSQSTTVALNNYAGTMILPRNYEKAVNTIGQWNSYEMWASILGAASIALAKTSPTGLKQEIKELKESHERLAKSSGSFGQGPSTEAIRLRELDYDAEILRMERDLRKINFASAVNFNRPIFIFLYGVGWLGPARFGLSASNQIILSSISSDPKWNDNYLQLYVNNDQFAEEFRTRTDVFGTGLATDFISDFIEGGAPRKAFRAGKMFFINRDVTPEQLSSGSVTSFSRGDEGWNIRVAWTGRSENTVFEDIRAQRDYTSLALYSNNLALGTTLKNREDMAKYYRALTIAAAFLNMAIFRASAEYLPVSVATLGRLGIADLVITGFVDPTQFSQDELCNDEDMDDFLNWYKFWTGLSIGQSVFLTMNPSSNLLPFLGSKAKLLLAKSMEKSLPPAIKAAEAGGTPISGLKSWEKIQSQVYASQRHADLDEEIPKLMQQAGTVRREQLDISHQIQSYADANRIAPGQSDILRDATLHPSLTGSFSQLDKLNIDIARVGKAVQEKTNLRTEYGKLINPSQPGYGMFEKALGRVYKGLLLIDPVQMGKTVVGSQAMEYATTCKDTSYKIMAYQKISPGLVSGSIKDKLDPLKNFKSLNVSSLLYGLGEKADVAQLNEILNLRGYHNEEQGLLTPQDLFYLHLDGAAQQWWGVYDTLNGQGCFKLVHDDEKSSVTADSRGLLHHSKETGETTVLSDDVDRALFVQANQELAKTIVPNKMIETPLDCGDKEVLRVIPDRLGGKLAVTDSSCGAMDCMLNQLSAITGRGTSVDLTESGFGAVTAMYTTEGIATAKDGLIRFSRTSGTQQTGGFLGIGDTEESLRGTEIQAPSLDALAAAGGTPLPGNKLSILGNGKVVLDGYTGSSTSQTETSELGELRTIITEHGKIEYDAVGRRLVATIYSISVIPAKEAVRDITPAPGTLVDENGNEVPAINIQNVIPNVGSEKEVKEFNDALREIQRDITTGGPGGFQVIETENARYILSHNETTGQPTLEVREKIKESQTVTNPDGTTSTIERVIGENVKEYAITGEPYRDGEDIVFPTDQGEFRIALTQQDGQPFVQATGPDGYRDIAALLAAQGPNGILAFDPRTGLWYAFNGQDIPWNPDFANQGLGYFNSEDGARGVPGSDLFAPARRTGTGDSSQNSLLSVPSIPDNHALLALVLISSIVLGVAVVRYRRWI